MIPKTEFPISVTLLKRPTDAPTFLLWTIQNSPRARVRSSVLSLNRKADMYSQKLNSQFLWPFKEADGRADLSSVDNTELPTRARARKEFCIVS